MLGSGCSCRCFVNAQEYLPLGQFSQAEAAGFEALKAELQGSIKKGVDFVRSGEAFCCWHCSVDSAATMLICQL